ncbi:MAG: GNAT family N-acetyltransferase [Acidobacteria bacterium]|nr:MAG: GNAT family N-acetyltransferase [Acidobacteriota bacterium]
MRESRIVVRIASKEDVHGIVELQKANQIAQGGTLATKLEPHQVEEMMEDMPQIVACRDDKVVGFLLTTSLAVHKKQPVPILEEMLQAYPHAESDAYIYGPICVSKQERGKGLAKLMFERLLEEEPGRQGVLFIRGDNDSSLRAHKKMGMNKVAEFKFNETVFFVFAYTAKSQPRPS